jgi:hypothetical protein
MAGCWRHFQAELDAQRLDFDDFDNGQWITVFGASSNRFCMRNPLIYSIWEFSQALAITAIWIWTFYEEVLKSGGPECGGKFFLFLTHWSLTAQVFYVWLAWFTTLKANAMAYGRATKHLSMPWYAKSTWLLQDILLPTSFMVFVLYFVLIVDWSAPPGVGKAYFTHGLNFLLIILHVFFSQKPYFLVHGIYFLVLSVSYVAFTYVYHLAGGTSCWGEAFIYAAFDWRKTEATGTLAAMLLFVVAPIVNLLFWLLVSRCFPGRRDAVVDRSLDGDDGTLQQSGGQDKASQESTGEGKTCQQSEGQDTFPV